MSINKRVAIVTGGSKGIGKAISHALAAEGLSIAVIARNKEEVEKTVYIIKQRGGNAEGFCADVSDEKKCENIINEIYEHFGRIDILVNCAGILTASSIKEITRDEWDNVIATNLTGSFFMIQQVIPYMSQVENGRIINISSNAGRMGGYENSQSYTASKGGIIAITMGIARQLAPSGITVNVVCPGTIETEMTMLYDKEVKERLISRIPMGRLGKPEEVAATVCFLASAGAAYITGAVIDVNGGMYMG